jgi:hypothetical protein
MYKLVRPSAVLGGKYSKEKNGCLVWILDWMRSMNLEDGGRICEEDVNKEGVTGLGEVGFEVAGVEEPTTNAGELLPETMLVDMVQTRRQK